MPLPPVGSDGVLWTVWIDPHPVEVAARLRPDDQVRARVGRLPGEAAEMFGHSLPLVFVVADVLGHIALEQCKPRALLEIRLPKTPETVDECADPQSECHDSRDERLVGN